MTEQLREIKKLLSRRLKKDRYEHTIGVMYNPGCPDSRTAP